MTFLPGPDQQSLPGLCEVSDALDWLSQASEADRGAIFTRLEVVDFILDLVGYDVSKPLHTFRLLEPSAGDGEFLLRAVKRLLDVADRETIPLEDLVDQIRVVELHQTTCQNTRIAVQRVLVERGAPRDVAEMLASNWVLQGDFLLQNFARTFTHVVGNPPYVRQELIPEALLKEYRRRYSTMYDRADLYVAFIERSLNLLEPRGTLGFICSDRWMKNKYGGPLRALISASSQLKFFIDMVDTPAFQNAVMAYPAITVFQKGSSGPTRIVKKPEITAAALSKAASALLSDAPSSLDVAEVSGVTAGNEPWILEHFERLTLIRRLEAALPTLEAAGCTVGIGVATGADHAFIGPFDELDVEPDRKLPLVMRSDIKAGTVQWQGHGIINPFLPSGKLADFEAYPKFAAHILARQELIDKRHVAKKNPGSWYRTIDRIYPDLLKKPKLLIPDIAGEANIVFEVGVLYPHHNLYYLTSDIWDLEALRAVLISGIAKAFIETYSTKMRGGYLRYQAQYLRRIRVPHWNDVSASVREALILGSRSGDQDACNEAVAMLYDLSSAERAVLNIS